MTQSSMRGYMTSHPEIKGYAGRKGFRSTALEDIVHFSVARRREIGFGYLVVGTSRL